MVIGWRGSSTNKPVPPFPRPMNGGIWTVASQKAETTIPTANTAPRGIQESFGVMVNYLYDLDSIEANHEAFVRNGTVARSGQVEALLAPPH